MGCLVFDISGSFFFFLLDYKEKTGCVADEFKKRNHPVHITVGKVNDLSFGTGRGMCPLTCAAPPQCKLTCN